MHPLNFLTCTEPLAHNETEIEQHGKVKTGRYIDGIWICHDCLETEEGKRGIKEEIMGYYSTTIQCDTIGVACI